MALLSKLPPSYNDLHRWLKPLSKEERRIRALAVANTYTQLYPLGTNDKEVQQVLRHSFAYLNVDDISKYIGPLMANMPRKEARLYWVGEPPLWASTCRMMHTYYQREGWEQVWNTSVADASTATAHVLSGLYCVAYDKEYFDHWRRLANDNSEMAWLSPALFNGWETIDLNTKIKVWTVQSYKGDLDLCRKFAAVFGWSKQWEIGEDLLPWEQIASPDKLVREQCIRQLVDGRQAVKSIPLPSLEGMEFA